MPGLLVNPKSLEGGLEQLRIVIIKSLFNRTEGPT
jgi:hypothetical protein